MCLQLLSSASQQDMLQVCGKDCRNSLSLIPGKSISEVIDFSDISVYLMSKYIKIYLKICYFHVNSRQTFTFTIWEEAIIEDEGKKLLTQFQEYPIIFARRIGVSKYNGKLKLTILHLIQRSNVIL